MEEIFKARFPSLYHLYMLSQPAVGLVSYGHQQTRTPFLLSNFLVPLPLVQLI